MTATAAQFLNRAYIQKAYLYSLMLFCVSIFLPMRIATNIAIAFLIIVWIAEGNFRYKLKRLKSSPLAAFSIILFLLYIIGLLYTSNLTAGLKYLETKASLIIFPIVLTSAAIRKTDLQKTLLFFSWACVIFSFIALLYQIKVVNDKNDMNYLFSDGLVLIYGKQAVYYSLYVAFSILVLVGKIFFEYQHLSPKEKILHIASVIFLFLFLFLLASRTSLAVLVLLVTVTALVIGAKKQMLKYAVLLLASILLFFSTLSFFFPQTLSRFESIKNFDFKFQNKSAEYHYAFDNASESWNGLNLRLAKWVCALDVIKENPILGVGTGDIKDDLVKSYISRNFFYAAEKRFDPHNQYLETTVGIGLLGLSILFLFYFYPLYLAILHKYWLSAAFSILIIFCSITESVLSSAHGIIFIGFFTFIFVKLMLEDEACLREEEKSFNKR